MNTLSQRIYLETGSKYFKLKKRFDKNVKSGAFYDFSKTKQRSIVSRLRKLFEKLLRLKNMLKLATAGATMALALTAGQANAQDFKMKKPFNGKFTTELNAQKNFESDVFIQMTGLDNPFGSENPFDGQIVSEADYSNLTDLDNDGDFDVVSINYDYSSYLWDIKYYKNIGNNTKAELIEQTGTDNPFDGLTFVSRPYLSFVDIDGDADYDAFINDQYANQIYYYKNTGTAVSAQYTEQTGTDNPLNGIYPDSMDRLNFADIDNDGDLDVFIGAYNNYPYLYRNTGTASAPVFVAEDATSLFDNTEGWQESLVLADLDGDGDLDAIINGELYYKNEGSNTVPAFVKKTGNDNPFENLPYLSSDLITLTDIDGDSDLDLFFGDGNKILFYENTGTTANAIFEDRNGIVVYTYVTAPAFADIDNDGDFDMFISGYDLSTYEIKVNFFKNTGTNLAPVFVQQFGIDNPMNNFPLNTFINYPEFADIDNDGDFDLILGTQNSPYELIQYYKNTGTAGVPVFELQTGVDNPFSAITGRYAFISLVDIDNDADLDLFRGSVNDSGDETLSFYRNTGNAGAAVFESQTSPIVLPADLYICFPDFTDIDDDGDYDLFAGILDYSDYTWSIKHYLNMGNPETPAFAEMTGNLNPLGLEIYVPVPVFVDSDADSDPDCFVGTYGGQILYFRNKTINVSTEDITNESLKLYPNPTNGIVMFDTEVFGNAEITVSVSDITGKQMSNISFTDYNKIDLGELKAGIYFVKISNNSVSKVSKIVVQ